VHQTLGAVFVALLQPPPFDAPRTDDLVRRAESIPATLEAARTNLAVAALQPFAALAIGALRDVRSRLSAVANGCCGNQVTFELAGKRHLRPPTIGVRCFGGRTGRIGHLPKSAATWTGNLPNRKVLTCSCLAGARESAPGYRHPVMVSLLIRDAWVLDLDRPFERADVLIEGSRIAQIGPGLNVQADRSLEATGKVLMPGMINAHTHSAQILERGHGDRLPLDAWMLSAATAYGGPPPDARTLYVTAAWSALVQLKSGCTGCLDHANVPFGGIDAGYDAIMQAYADTGLRAAVAMSMGDLDFFETLPRHLVSQLPVPTMDRTPPPTGDLLAAGKRFLERWKGKVGRLQPFVGPSAPQRCSDELLDGCFGLAETYDTGIHSHVLEARSQWFACQERFGTSPVAYLEKRGWLSQRLSCAHGVWLSRDDMDRLTGSGAAVVHNPVSNLRVASGIANLQELLARGTTVALGADGAASNDNQNMWEVVKLTSILHRVYGERSAWVSAETALRLCLQGGAAVLRQAIGAIRIGHEADLVILGGPDIFIRPKELMINSLVLGELGRSVETVIVAGEVVVENGRSTRVDEEQLWREANDTVQASLEQLPERRAFLAERLPYLEHLLAAVEQTPGGPPPVVMPGRPIGRDHVAGRLLS
jgi:cytosine/adenosine deaminase-related metal-dependent hydrolase